VQEVDGHVYRRHGNVMFLGLTEGQVVKPSVVENEIMIRMVDIWRLGVGWREMGVFGGSDSRFSGGRESTKVGVVTRSAVGL
jgi:hypothetical protein